jgi:hypothetical protein
MGSVPVPKLLTAFRLLTPWTYDWHPSGEDWGQYLEAARLVQPAERGDVERALARFLDEAAGLAGVENETRLFLLMRVVFDLPDRAPVNQRRVFKGWVNWPAPDAEGHVNLSWPVGWREGRPVLLAPYEGAEGPRYAAVEEYRHLLDHFPLRRLSQVKG